MSRALVALLVLVLAGAGGYYARQQLSRDDAPVLADNRSAFTLPDMEGTPRSLGEWQDKALLVNFWATWCAPCRREIPLLKRTQDAHADDNIQVIGIAVDYLEDVAAYAETAGFNYPILIGQEDAMAAAESSGIEFIGLPFTMVVAPGGQLVTTHMGEIVDAQVDEIVDVLGRLQRGDLDISGAREALGRL
jgi:thiol-disulfide isomerase/thioredoxin